MFFMGLDISTTAAKALLIDTEGSIIASHSSPLQVGRPKPLWSEQEPSDWWARIAESIQAVRDFAPNAEISAIGLTGQMHGLVLLDQNHAVLRPAILWNDQRTAAQCDWIRERVGRDRLIQLTGNDALTGFTAPKLLWVREHEPEIYARVSSVVLPKDYIRFRLTGELATDLAGAAGTLLLDVAHRTWSLEMIEALELSPDWFPATHEGIEPTGTVTARAAAETRLSEGTPVFAGGGDQATQAVGVGAISPDKVAVTLGTSGVVFAPSDRYIFEKAGRLHAFCHAVPKMWHLMGVMLSAGGSFRWYRDIVAPDLDFETLSREAQLAPAGAEGLVFLPYLTGERTPHADPKARGAFVGLTARHTRSHLTRAVLEGVGFGLKDSYQLMRSVGIDPDSVVISGGGARSNIWRQIISDVLDTPLVTVDSEEGAAFGAALLAAVGTGEFNSVTEACSRTIHVRDVTEPGANVSDYTNLYPRYRELYPSLAKTFSELSGFTRAD